MGFFFVHGSRDESQWEAGFSHVWEHMVFKGTSTRSAYRIASEVDRVGGEINAYTDKEETALLATVPAREVLLALEILLDLAFDAAFPVEELAKELNVIRNEIHAVSDDPEDHSYEEFLKELWKGHPLSLPVAGTWSSIKTLNRKTLVEFAGRHFNTDTLVIAVAGRFDVESVVSFLSSRLQPSSGMGERTLRMPEQRLFKKQIKNHFQMTQIILGNSFPMDKDHRTFLILQLFSFAFGENMSSRLFQNIRENRGLCYSVYSFLTDLTGVGGLNIAASCSPGSAEQLLSALAGEWRLVKTSGLTEVEWAAAQSYAEGSALLAHERTENRVSRLFHLFQRCGVVLPLEDSLEMIRSLSWAEARTKLEKTLFGHPLSVLVYGGRTSITSRVWDEL